ncbi:hypothetical protein K469DRAFT_740767 [Zopfia rhizophila CBS 207.26]|uniref:BTB domain-containing protein n=1 Tax=Zopfia rhizophila CBS 207.26 TaxID=1314779 RepID=A0A6A6DSY6_9PEZI|nr:hypothetical protein K469DRAFT_740767 [Zopfia rhizophila CBS 207.26]
MASPYLIDPDGDVDLLLRQEEAALQLDSEFDVPSPPPSLDYRRPITPEPEISKKKNKKGKETPILIPEHILESEPGPGPAPITEGLGLARYAGTDPNPEPNADVAEQPVASDPDETLVRIRVSSKHLMLASSYFKRNLGSGLAESDTLRSHGHLELAMSGQDPEVTLIVMNIIHGRTRKVPPSVDVNMLTKIAVLVDYLQCHEVIEPFSDKWIKKRKGNIPETYSRELVQWLCISLVFNQASLFKAITRTVLRRATGLVETLGLPIRDCVADKLNQYRSATIEQLLSGLETLLDNLRLDQTECTECNFKCNAMRYGTLAKELGYRGLLFPRPKTPFLGYSFENLVSSILHIRDSPYHIAYQQHCGQLRRLVFARIPMRF